MSDENLTNKELLIRIDERTRTMAEDVKDVSGRLAVVETCTTTFTERWRQHDKTHEDHKKEHEGMQKKMNFMDNIGYLGTLAGSAIASVIAFLKN